MAAYAHHVDVSDPVHQTLDPKNDRSFGSFGFHYDPQARVVRARVYVVRTLDREYPERLAAIRKVRAALNDPRIGGLYEKAGGAFWHDEDQQILFLVEDFRSIAASKTSSKG